jgi:hypothetical protein
MSSTAPGRRGAGQSQTWMRGLYQIPRYPSQTGAPRVQERALHRRELGGLSPLQTMCQLPNHQQRQRLPHHSQQSQSGVHTSGKHCL